MKLTFSKKLHGNKTLRFIDIITTDGMDNDKHATMIYVPTQREYITLDYNRGINTDLIVAIRYIANCHISQSSQVLIDFSNTYGDRYYHFTDASGSYYNFNDVVPYEEYEEYSEFIYKLISVMDNYS